ncbi:hypothetical protein PanWU01x14_349290, partial [Parasponia andersonii]
MEERFILVGLDGGLIPPPHFVSLSAPHLPRLSNLPLSASPESLDCLYSLRSDFSFSTSL